MKVYRLLVLIIIMCHYLQTPIWLVPKTISSSPTNYLCHTQKPNEYTEVNQIVLNDNDGPEFSRIADLPDLSEILGDIESNNQNHRDTSLPSIDDLFDEENELTVETPDLPDFDDIF